jgi:hypothetical protein
VRARASARMCMCGCIAPVCACVCMCLCVPLCVCDVWVGGRVGVGGGGRPTHSQPVSEALSARPGAMSAPIKMEESVADFRPKCLSGQRRVAA